MLTGLFFGSGAGVVVLKRYEDAVADGDFIHAVILGSAVNNDGARKVGFTAPSVSGQADVILEALETAGVHADEVGLIEAHGTGTRLGDPIEVRALQSGFAAQRDQPDLAPLPADAQAARCYLGSVKSNIGHLDTAAGVAGLIKAALAVRHAEIPATLNFDRLNPEIDLSGDRFEIATAHQPWPRAASGGVLARRVAGVSAFGIGGTNVHMIVGSAPGQPAQAAVKAADPQALFLSARSAAALAQYRLDMADWLEQPAAEAHPLPAIAATLRTKRPDAAWRLAVTACDRGEAAAALRAASLPVDHVPANASAGTLAFVFPGQGSQYPEMIAPHYARHATYRAAYERVIAAMPAALRAVLADLAQGTHVPAATLAQTEITQPALFAASYAAAAEWEARGLHPDAGMMGHSIGEYTAACLAGVMTPETAARIVAARGAVMQAAPVGSMLAVGQSADDLAPYLHDSAVDIAALNGPRQTVLSGTKATITALGDQLAADGHRSVALATSHGFHSHLFDAAAAQFAEIIAGEQLAPPQARVISNVTGDVLDAKAATDPAYWARQMRAPVRFHDGLQTLMAAPTPPQTLLEVGPGATLTGLIRQAGLHPQPTGIAGTQPAQNNSDPFLDTAATLWTHGHKTTWTTPPHTTTPIPTPKLNTQNFWINETKKQSNQGVVKSHIPTSTLSVEARLSQIWQALLGADTIGGADDFFERGGTSLDLAELVERISDTFGVTLGAQEIGVASRFNAQVALLTTRQTAPAKVASERLVRIGETNGSDEAVVFVHPIGGSVLAYQDIADALPRHIDKVAIPALGLQPDDEALSTVEEMAAHYVSELSAFTSANRMHLVGSSFGGLVTHAMSLALANRGECHAYLLDSPYPAHPMRYRAGAREILSELLPNALRQNFEAASKPENSKIELIEIMSGLDPQFRNLRTEDALQRLDVFARNQDAMFRYRPVQTKIGLTYLRARSVTSEFDAQSAERAWLEHSRTPQTHVPIPGDHNSMLHDKGAAKIAQIIRERLGVSAAIENTN